MMKSQEFQNVGIFTALLVVLKLGRNLTQYLRQILSDQFSLSHHALAPFTGYSGYPALACFDRIFCQVWPGYQVGFF